MIDPLVNLIQEDNPQRTRSPLTAPAGRNAPGLEVFQNPGVLFPGGGAFKNFPDHRRLAFQNFKMAVRPLAVPVGDAAIREASLGVEAQPPLDVLGQVCAIVFGGPLKDTFKQDTLWPIRYAFLCVDHPDPVTLEPVLVGGGIVTVTGKPVHLPAKDIGPSAPLGILEHFLELRPLVTGAGQGPVGVDLYNP